MWNRKWSSWSFSQCQVTHIHQTLHFKLCLRSNNFKSHQNECRWWSGKWGKEKEGAFQVLAINNIESQGPHTCCFETRLHINPHHIQLTTETLPWLKNLCKLSNFKLSQLLSLSCPVLWLWTVAPHFLFQSTTKAPNFWRNRTRVAN